MKNYFVKALNNPIVMAAVLMVTAAVGMGVEAHAFTAPVAGSLGYEIYDVAVNDILKGPIGFVAGLGLVAYGIFSAVQVRMLPAALGILGGGILFVLDNIVTSLGYVI